MTIEKIDDAKLNKVSGGWFKIAYRIRINDGKGGFLFISENKEVYKKLHTDWESNFFGADRYYALNENGKRIEKISKEEALDSLAFYCELSQF